jgi:hypothetical protein
VRQGFDAARGGGGIRSSKALNRLLRAASLVVTDRRWAAPLSAMALGFGLFIGVAIGPGTAGSLATGAQQIIEVPGLAGTAGSDGSGSEGGGSIAALGGPSSGASVEETSPLGAALPSSLPLAPEEVEPAPEEESPRAPSEAGGEESESEGQTLAGVVVHDNPAAESYALALSGGELVAVHATKLPAPGTKLSLPLRHLANGSFAEAGTREQAGKANSATFNGTVTFLDPTPEAPAYVVSGRGMSVLVHVHPDPSGATPQLPALGSYATVKTQIAKRPASTSSAPIPVLPVDSGVGGEAPVAAAAEPTAASLAPPAPTCAPDPNMPPPVASPSTTILWQRQLKVDGEPATYTELAGFLTALCPETGQLLLSADDSRESGKDLLLKVGPGIDSSKLTLGSSFLATATIEADGALVLDGITDDERIKGADDSKSAQGDLKR